MGHKTKSAVWAVGQTITAILLTCALFFLIPFQKEKEHELHILSTNDVHGAWFDSTYVGSRVRPSLVCANAVIDSVRNLYDRKNVLLIDAGDCLQGDNAAYYYNYVETRKVHLYPRIAKYMGYDAVVVGNHDVETGHAVYDRVSAQMKRLGIPFLAGNAIRDDNGKPYWPEYKVFRRAGLKVLVLGYTNANIAAWLDEEIWSGMHFESLMPFVQGRVDALRGKLHPDVVIVAVHSGTGKGDGSQLESQGLDLFNSLRGVDAVICSHDHRPLVLQNDSSILLNSGSRAHNVAHGVIKAGTRGRKLVSKIYGAELLYVDKFKADAGMRHEFSADFNAVKAFTVREIGGSSCDLSMRDAFTGQCPMLNLIHSVQLRSTGADISFAAPLSQNGFVPAGKLIYNDLFVIYPYENTLFKVRLTGAQIRSYLEYSYEQWVNDPIKTGHALKIRNARDPRFGRESWSFVHRSYNFDSAAGLNYTVDLLKPFGERVSVSGLADGRAFDETAEYSVAMTSYRASGGGGLLSGGAGVDPSKVEVLGKYPEIRDLIYQFISENGALEEPKFSDPRVVGEWRFVPEVTVRPFIELDMNRLFGR